MPDIAVLLDATGSDRSEHLRRQLDLLDHRLSDLAEQREVLRRAWEGHRMGIDLDPQEIVEVFGDDDPTRYAQEARERWADTDAYAQSARRTSRHTKEDWLAARQEAASVEAELVANLVAGEPADGARARAAAEAHRAQICRWYYDCGYELHAGLAQLYLADVRFTAHYDALAPGLARYLHDAITANAASAT